MNLEKSLQEYKLLTLKLINSVENIDEVENLIKARQDIIDKIQQGEYDKNHFKEVAEKLGLSNIEEELIGKVKKEKVKAKIGLDNARKLKQARNIYNREESESFFFNRTSY